jgi:hypothetical protein
MILAVLMALLFALPPDAPKPAADLNGVRS